LNLPEVQKVISSGASLKEKMRSAEGKGGVHTRGETEVQLRENLEILASLSARGKGGEEG